LRLLRIEENSGGKQPKTLIEQAEEVGVNVMSKVSKIESLIGGVSFRPKLFAKDYLERTFPLPYFFDIPITRRNSYKDGFQLDSMGHLELDRKVEDKIYRSLYEFRYVIASSKDALLQKENKKIVKQRKDTIKFLEKALEYPYLTAKTKKCLLIEIKRLKNIDRMGVTYHPVHELAIQSEVGSLFVKLLEKTISSNDKEKIRRIREKWEAASLETHRGRPQKFFFKTLQIVIFKLLNEDAGIPIEKAKELTATIINEYFSKFGVASYIECEQGVFKSRIDSPFCNLKSKDIDNALHGC